VKWAIDSIMRSSVGLHLSNRGPYTRRLKPPLHRRNPPTRVEFLQSRVARTKVYVEAISIAVFNRRVQSREILPTQAGQR